MRKHLIFIALVIVVSFASCNIKKPEKKLAQKKSPNIILMIGDGMGLSELSSTFYYGEGESNFLRFDEIGFINTSSADSKITDSAAGATSLASDTKTYNGAIGLDADSISTPTLVEVLSKINYNTALLATSSITHATPAAFYAHVKNRNMQNEIAEQMVNSDIDFFAAGGLKFFQNRQDGKNLMAALSDKGFVVNDTLNQNYNMDKKYAFLLADDGMPAILKGRGDFLPEYTQHAIDYLTASDKPFFMMVEGSQIDWGGHDMNADYLISEMLDFDKTVGVALDFAEKDGNTLLVVLGDHETGGFTLGADNGNYNKIKPVFSTTSHSATLIPVFAYGPGADNFKGIYQNSEIFNKIMMMAN
ncbi:MAG: alkaline phosphatase [Marinilabiliales bacterium]|mgnify:CR=1 FL=1|nr:MAG: alkaline phosphatase [Marinilabiliales bacterium]